MLLTNLFDGPQDYLRLNSNPSLFLRREQQSADALLQLVTDVYKKTALQDPFPHSLFTNVAL